MSDEAISSWVETEVLPSTRALDPAFVDVDPALAAALATRHSRTFSAAAVKTTLGDELLTPDIPRAKPEFLALLGADGVIGEGAEVEPGTILIGKITPKAASAPTSEQKLLRAMFGERASDVRDTSLRCPTGCAGIVERAGMVENQAKDELARAEVVVGWDRPVVAGDELLIATRGGLRRVVVARIAALAGGAGLAWAGEAGHLRVAKASMVEDQIHARSIGPYSLVTQQPLAGREQFGGQALTPRQAAALAGSAPWTAWEMFSIKSDSVDGRLQAYSSLVRRVDIELPDDPPALPGESVTVLASELAALTIEIDPCALQLGPRLRTPAEIRARSHGEVKKPETINYRTHIPERDGLFCARIFGPVRDYTCICGKYEGREQRGAVCDKCGVEVIASRVRRERFGHVELPVPVAHPLFKSALAEVLGISRDGLDALLAGRSGLDGSGALRSMEEAGEEVELATGGWALRQALDAGADAATGVSIHELVLEVVPVLPPDLRPLVPLEGGRFATSDLNDLYRRVINRRNRLARLIELDAPTIILDNEFRELQQAVDQLFDNEGQAKSVKYQGRALESLTSVIEAHFAELVRRRVDYSGVTRFVADPELGPGRIRLPRRMAVELYKPMAYGVLEERGLVTTIKGARAMVEAGGEEALDAIEAASRARPILLANEAGLVAREVELWDEAAVALDPGTARLLAGSDGLSAVCVHLPLSSAARAELLDFDDITLEGEPETEVGGWLSAAVFEGHGVARVVEAAVEGSSETLVDPLLRAALGRGPDDGEAHVAARRVRRSQPAERRGGASEDDYDF